MSLMIKICGMREPENIRKVTELKPDVMGFIFYRYSPRYAGEVLNPEIIAEFPSYIRRAGVFVNSTLKEITTTVRKFSLDIVQLHGNESPEMCRRLSETGITVIKAFNIEESTGFGLCSEFINGTKYFLFDAPTVIHGGSGNKFDWKILHKYDLGHPFFLSGGISPRDVSNVLGITNPAFHGVDLNSRFEVKPGLKDIDTLKKFIYEIRLNNKLL
jgi:phosphoribosylanthranilate isomerase